jgi:hypothetical protein
MYQYIKQRKWSIIYAHSGVVCFLMLCEGTYKLLFISTSHSRPTKAFMYSFIANLFKAQEQPVVVLAGLLHDVSFPVPLVPL